MQKQFRLIILLALLTSFSGIGQEQPRLLKGRAKSLSNDVSDVLIVNLNSRKSTITDSLGLFVIEVKLKDSLRITAVQYLTKEIIITKKIFQENSVVVNLVEDVIDLDEVTVTPYFLTGKIDLDLEKINIAPNVNSARMGLPNANIVKLTPSERLLIEADGGKYINYYGIALTINTHKIMNKLSGRTKALEKLVARDEKMELEKEIIAKFSKKSMSESFNIPETSIDGFLSYCLLQKDFSELSEWSTTEVWEYLKIKSVEFNETDFIKD